jgi:hypothetical protein
MRSWEYLSCANVLKGRQVHAEMQYAIITDDNVQRRLIIFLSITVHGEDLVGLRFVFIRPVFVGLRRRMSRFADCTVEPGLVQHSQLLAEASVGLFAQPRRFERRAVATRHEIFESLTLVAFQ